MSDLGRREYGRRGPGGGKDTARVRRKVGQGSTFNGRLRLVRG